MASSSLFSVILYFVLTIISVIGSPTHTSNHIPHVSGSSSSSSSNVSIVPITVIPIPAPSTMSPDLAMSSTASPPAKNFLTEIGINAQTASSSASVSLMSSASSVSSSSNSHLPHFGLTSNLPSSDSYTSVDRSSNGSHDALDATWNSTSNAPHDETSGRRIHGPVWSYFIPAQFIDLEFRSTGSSHGPVIPSILPTSTGSAGWQFHSPNEQHGQHTAPEALQAANIYSPTPFRWTQPGASNPGQPRSHSPIALPINRDGWCSSFPSINLFFSNAILIWEYEWTPSQKPLKRLIPLLPPNQCVQLATLRPTSWRPSLIDWQLEEKKRGNREEQ